MPRMTTGMPCIDNKERYDCGINRAADRADQSLDSGDLHVLLSKAGLPITELRVAPGPAAS